MIHVYILKSLKDNSYYIGITRNIENRLVKHNRGGVYSTKNRKPLILLKSEVFENYSEAREREKEIKSFKGGNNFRKLITS